MSDQPDTGSGAALPPEYQQQAAEAVGQVQADPGVDAADTIEQIKASAVRAALGEFEQQLASSLAAAQAAMNDQQSALEAQIANLTRQLATVRSQAGPPDAQRLATALAQRVQSIAIANPDLGGVHFAGVISQAASLADQVKAIAEQQSTDVAAAENTARGIAAWFTRAHPRISSKILEGSHVALDELERIVEDLPNLLPVAAAVVKAL